MSDKSAPEQPPGDTANSSQGEKKAYLTKEEAAALDDDAFFKAYKAGLIERREDAWTEENFEEEMEKHPLFMTKQPTAADFESNPHLQAMQEMFHELTPLERAEHHKTHGNEHYKKALKNKSNPKVHKKHLREAVHMYTEGLREMSNDDAMESILLSNRSMCHLLLKNNGSALKDAVLATKYNPENIKAYYRAGRANFQLGNYADAVTWCDTLLSLDPENKEALDIRTKSLKAKAVEDKLRRKREAEERKQKAKRAKVDKAIELRRIRMGAVASPSTTTSTTTTSAPVSSRSPADDAVMKYAQSTFNQASGVSKSSSREASPVSGGESDDEEHVEKTLLPAGQHGPILKEDEMLWPVLLLYPEHAQSDFIQEFSETNSISDHLQVLFPDSGTPSVPWDEAHAYKADNLDVYFEAFDSNGEQKGELVPVDTSSPLLYLLQDPDYCVIGDVPMFLVVPKGEKYAKEFTKRYKIRATPATTPHYAK